jgi:hypothetical protein
MRVMNWMGQILALFLTLATFAGAQAEEKSQPLLAEFPPDAEVCYGRRYDAAHLARHPRQKVTAIYLFRSLTADPQDEERPKSRGEMATENIEWEKTTRAEGETVSGFLHGRTSLEVAVKFRDRRTVFRHSVECRKPPGQGFSCGVDCDGGAFGAALEGRTLVIRQSAHSGGLRVQSGCSSGDESAPDVRINPDDDGLVFRLEPLAISACLSARDSARPDWVTAGAEPLRARFAHEADLCFTAPADVRRQTRGRIARLHLHARGKLKEADADAPALEMALDAVLADGRAVSKTVDCRPENYAFACTAEQGGFRLTRNGRQGATLRESYYEGGDIARLLGLPELEKFAPLDLAPADAATCRGAAR